jgi:ABC-type sugar transport system ATPase subunit
VSELKITNLYKRYGTVEILKKINLDIRSGEFVVFVGPSGCGKSTLLRCIAGLETISEGTLEIDGEVVNERAPSRRGIAMVFQTYALYPHMNVFDNMAYSLRLQNTPKDQIKQKVEAAAATLQLSALLDRLPKQLSGGQRQRVAIGRAIVRNPKVFLFDEPLSNLDAALRVATRIEIAKLSESMPNTTMIYVTHDQVEAMTLANRIVVLRGGVVEQVGTPMELYHHPQNLFVARFIGSPAMNVAPCVIEGANGDARVKSATGASVKVPTQIPGNAVGMKAMLGVRPEDLRLASDGDAIFRGELLLAENLGEVTILYVDAGKGQDPIIAKLDGGVEMQRGVGIGLTADTGSFHLFDEKGQAFPRQQA